MGSAGILNTIAVLLVATKDRHIATIERNSGGYFGFLVNRKEDNMIEESYVQKELFEFATEMNKILKENDKEKGDSWKYMPIKELLGMLNSHHERLVDAIYREDEASIMDESIDMANMCMMIFSHVKPPEVKSNDRKKQ